MFSKKSHILFVSFANSSLLIWELNRAGHDLTLNSIARKDLNLSCIDYDFNDL